MCDHCWSQSTWLRWSHFHSSIHTPFTLRWVIDFNFLCARDIVSSFIHVSFLKSIFRIKFLFDLVWNSFHFPNDRRFSNGFSILQQFRLFALVNRQRNENFRTRLLSRSYSCNSFYFVLFLYSSSSSTLSENALGYSLDSFEMRNDSNREEGMNIFILCWFPLQLHRNAKRIISFLVDKFNFSSSFIRCGTFKQKCQKMVVEKLSSEVK